MSWVTSTQLPENLTAEGRLAVDIGTTLTAEISGGATEAKQDAQAVTDAAIAASVASIDTKASAGNVSTASIDSKTVADVGGTPADGVSNTVTLKGVRSWLAGYNGTTWDRLRTGITTAVSSFVGWLNVIPFGKYLATDLTLTDGQGGPLTLDATSALRATLRSYDAASGANKSIDVAQMSEQWDEYLYEATNIGAADNYYPSSAGVSMAGYKSFAAAETTSGGCTTTIQATYDTAAVPTWYDVSLAAYNPITNATGVASWVDTGAIQDYPDANVTAFRVKIVTSDATNGIKLAIRRVKI